MVFGQYCGQCHTARDEDRNRTGSRQLIIMSSRRTDHCPCSKLVITHRLFIHFSSFSFAVMLIESCPRHHAALFLFIYFSSLFCFAMLIETCPLSSYVSLFIYPPPHPTLPHPSCFVTLIETCPHSSCISFLGSVTLISRRRRRYTKNEEKKEKEKKERKKPKRADSPTCSTFLVSVPGSWRRETERK